MHWTDAPDARLALTIILNAAVLWTSTRLARLLDERADPVQRAIDVILLFSAVAGGSVALLGWLGLLDVGPLVVVVAVIAAATVVLTRRVRPGDPPGPEPQAGRLPYPHVLIGFCTLGLLLVMLWVARVRPPLVTDALTYHLVLSARWLQCGGIDLQPIWFHNPGNTYSPVWASCLFAWFMLPMGNDLLARFVQVPFLILCGLCVYQLLRRAEVDAFVAAGAGAMLCLARPFMGEGFCAKDDVVLAAYVLCLVLSLAPDRMRTLGGGVRAGVSLGMLLATKYIAILALPMLVVLSIPSLLDAQARRRWLWVLVPPLLIAGPWYLRNLLLAGNPLYPIEVRIGSHVVLPGLFCTEVADAYRGLDGLVKVFLNTGRFALRPWMLIMLVLGWIAAVVLAARHWKRQPILAGLVGPPVFLATFYLVSPDREIRYIFAVVALLFLAGGLAIGRLPGPAWIRRGLTTVLLVCSLLIEVTASLLVDSILIGLALGTMGYLAFVVWRRKGPTVDRQVRVGAVAVATLLACGYAYVYWGVYVDRCRGDYPLAWSIAYRQGGLGQAWAWVTREASPNDVIASAGTPMTYPLMGFDLERRVVYVPVQDGAESYTDLPTIGPCLTSSQIVPATSALYRNAPDRDTWLERLQREGVRYLLTTCFLGAQPIEYRWAVADARFRIAFQSEATTVFELRD